MIPCVTRIFGYKSIMGPENVPQSLRKLFKIGPYIDIYPINQKIWLRNSIGPLLILNVTSQLKKTAAEISI